MTLDPTWLPHIAGLVVLVSGYAYWRILEHGWAREDRERERRAHADDDAARPAG